MTVINPPTTTVAARRRQRLSEYVQTRVLYRVRTTLTSTEQQLTASYYLHLVCTGCSGEQRAERKTNKQTELKPKTFDRSW